MYLKTQRIFYIIYELNILRLKCIILNSKKNSNINGHDINPTNKLLFKFHDYLFQIQNDSVLLFPNLFRLYSIVFEK